MAKKKDKIDELNEHLKEVVHRFDRLKAMQINEDILVSYLAYKTKLPMRDVRDFLKNYNEFHENLINREALKKLEEESDDHK